MLLLDLTLPTPEENLALDEALLEESDAGTGPTEVLRFWESPEPLVVLGRSSKVAEEVRLDACRERGFVVRRRASGGATIVAGPGCLMYAVVLSESRRPGITLIDHAHATVLDTLVTALRPAIPDIARKGTSDLAMGTLKVSGNALRVKRNAVLYHGTLLYDFPLDVLPELLDFAPRQPDYRAGRGHREFVANLPLSASELRQRIAEAWQATQPMTSWPAEFTRKLATERYQTDAWNLAR
jgi:lipoate-protein ligase A